MSAAAGCRGLLIVAVAAAVLASGSIPSAQLRLADESDRLAFRAWFVLLADAAYYRPPADVGDCAALVRYAMREALRPHTPEWVRRAALPLTPAIPDVISRPTAAGGLLPLFRVAADGAAPMAEFADARTLIRWNTRPISRDVADVRPGDILYYRQALQHQPDHLMVFVGPSRLDASASDFLVYHTGPDDSGPGEMRKVRLADLARHPAPRWRPTRSNDAFVGVFRLIALS